MRVERAARALDMCVCAWWKVVVMCDVLCGMCGFAVFGVGYYVRCGM